MTVLSTPPASLSLPPSPAQLLASRRFQALRLAFAGGLLLVCVLQAVHSWPALAAGTAFPNLNNDARSNPWLELGHTLGVCGLFGAYLLTLARWPQRPLAVRQVVALLVPSSLLAWLALPATSTDVMFYIGVGRMLVLHGANPYLHVYDEFQDGFASYLDWADATMPYGPLLLPCFSAAGWLSAHSPIAAIYLLKAWSLLIYGGSCWALHRLLRALGRDGAFGLFLFALNPLVLLDQLGNGHNDGLMLLFGMLGLWALARQREGLGLCLGLLSALSKLPGVVFLALVVARLLWRRQWAALARGALFGLLVGGVLHWLLFPSWGALLSLTNPLSTSVNSLHRLLLEAVAAWRGWSEETPGYDRFYQAERTLSMALFIAYFLWRLVAGRQRAGLQGLIQEHLQLLLVLLMAYTAWFLPWYTTWLLPLAALTESSSLRWASVAYSASVTAFFAFPGSVLGQSWQVLRTLLAHGVPLVLLLRAYLLARREPPAAATLCGASGGTLAERGP